MYLQHLSLCLTPSLSPNTTKNPNYQQAFGQVVMLYIDAEVNGQHIKAFVDSGAQSTIMSAACAERCNLTRLIDTRCALFF